MPKPRDIQSGVIYEFVPSGAYVKVSAVHVSTGTEVSIVGDANASQAHLERTALAKLKRVMAKDQGEEPKGRGTVV